ncbi:CAP domain-containing protein [Streptomyces sp. NBC_00190]|uniref:CAP domain-containing protein n=1 Tax=unclassified Streptomyces TaxID=2593676 RepID=UPI002E2C50C2|nr:CAP domain-containing protein [Streptomyces sp. NBC_00190]WSZ44431.1 CAP domain-containing protein [Streptomyces sp. NBC_00868]
MQKHRKRKQYKKISIAAVTLGIVGIPTAAIACWDTQETGTTRASERQSAPASPSAPSPVASIQNQAAPVATPTGTPEPTGQPTQDPQTAKPSTAATQPPRETQSAKPAPAPARPKPPVTSKPPSPPTAAPSGPAAEVVALVNKERAKAGCSALTVNDKLTAAALNHSKDMAAHSNMSHTGSDGSDPGARITRAGYAWMTYGENVAYGYSTPEQVMIGWMNSPGHRENILNCAFKEIGVGLAQPNSYWTQDFGAAR